MAEKRNKGIVILLNKWDVIEKTSNTEKEVIKAIKERIKPFDDVPIITISALDKTRVMKSLEMDDGQLIQYRESAKMMYGKNMHS